MSDVFSADLIRYQTPSEKYKRRAMNVAEQQLALAGYRLGEMLNQIFAAAPTRQTAEVNPKTQKIQKSN